MRAAVCCVVREEETATHALKFLVAGANVLRDIRVRRIIAVPVKIMRRIRLLTGKFARLLIPH